MIWTPISAYHRRPLRQAKSLRSWKATEFSESTPFEAPPVFHLGTSDGGELGGARGPERGLSRLARASSLLRLTTHPHDPDPPSIGGDVIRHSITHDCLADLTIVVPSVVAP